MDYYYFPNSHWSRVVSLMLREKSIDVKKHFVDIRKNASFEPDYLRLNPKGVVPTLVDGKRVVSNSPRIARFLEEKKPSPPMLQAHPEADFVTAWAKRLEQFPLMLFSYAVWVLGKRGERSKDILNDKVERAKQYAERFPELSSEYLRKAEFFRVFRAEVYDDDHVAAEQQRWQLMLDELAERVGTRSFIGGDAPCFADCIALSIFWRLCDIERMDAWSRDPGHPLTRYYARLKALDSFEYVFHRDELIPR